MNEHHLHVADMIAGARSRVEHLDPAALAAEMAGGDVVVVDLREAAERDESGSIPGSVHVPRGMLEFRADPASPYHLDDLDPQERTIVYCASGGRSALAADTLRRMGYERVAHLDGGFAAWVAHHDRAAGSTRGGGR